MPPREQITAVMGWTKDEDEALLKAVAVHGCKAWSAISCALPGRTGKACRERWFNHLNPRLRPEEWTPAEDATLFCTERSLLSLTLRSIAFAATACHVALAQVLKRVACCRS
jgi:hypothetical protein